MCPEKDVRKQCPRSEHLQAGDHYHGESSWDVLLMSKCISISHLPNLFVFISLERVVGPQEYRAVPGLSNQRGGRQCMGGSDSDGVLQG